MQSESERDKKLEDYREEFLLDKSHGRPKTFTRVIKWMITKLDERVLHENDLLVQCHVHEKMICSFDPQKAM